MCPGHYNFKNLPFDGLIIGALVTYCLRIVLLFYVPINISPSRPWIDVILTVKGYKINIIYLNQKNLKSF